MREAGGYVSDMAGGHDMMTSGDVLAANDHLHLPLAALIKEALRTGRRPDPASRAEQISLLRRPGVRQLRVD